MEQNRVDKLRVEILRRMIQDDWTGIARALASFLDQTSRPFEQLAEMFSGRLERWKELSPGDVVLAWSSFERVNLRAGVVTFVGGNFVCVKYRNPPDTYLNPEEFIKYLRLEEVVRIAPAMAVEQLRQSIVRRLPKSKLAELLRSRHCVTYAPFYGEGQAVVERDQAVEVYLLDSQERWPYRLVIEYRSDDEDVVSELRTEIYDSSELPFVYWHPQRILRPAMGIVDVQVSEDGAKVTVVLPDGSPPAAPTLYSRFAKIKLLTVSEA